MRTVSSFFVLCVALAGCDKSEPVQNTGAPSASAQVAPAPAPSSSVASAPSVEAKPTRPPAPLNVLFLSVDALRADMPWNGYERPIAPNLTKLAKEAVVYNH